MSGQCSFQGQGDSACHLLRDFTDELLTKSVLAYGRVERAVLLGRPVGPPRFDRLVFRAEHVFVDVAVLNYQRGDPLRLGDGMPETDLRAVVVEPERVALQAERLSDIAEHLGVSVEVIAELGGVRRVAVAKTRPVEGYGAPLIGERRHQPPELIGRARVSVRQEQDGSAPRSRFPEEQRMPANGGPTMSYFASCHAFLS